MRSQPLRQQLGLIVNEMRNDAASVQAIAVVSKMFPGDTTPTNYMHFPLQKSSIVIGDLISYKFGQGYGLINKLKTSFENDVHLEIGNLGIGTTSFLDGSDTYRLSVEGKVRAHSIKVYTDWADFIFEKDYQLLSLNEVEEYINENGHLKDIPSAKDVEKNGIELGEMNKLLLQKIEELTLYIIKLNKEVQILKAKK